MQIIKFLCSGVIGLTVNLGLLHILADIVDLYYLYASIIAVSISTIIGFLLQKYWTFNEPSVTRAPSQFVLYATVAITNIFINTAIVYTLVESVGIYYLFAQALGSASVAVISYLMYHLIIFKPVPVRG